MTAALCQTTAPFVRVIAHMDANHANLTPGVTGEIESRNEDVGGIGVHIAARALCEAGEGDIVVTRTVRDLATGTDLAFSPLGELELFAASAGDEN